MSNKTIRMLVRVGISLALLLFCLIHTSGIKESRLFTTLENLTYDGRVLLTMPRTVDPRIVIVDLDEKTLAAEGWPMPRRRMAQLVSRLLDEYHVRVIGFDVLFGEPDRTSGVERLDQLAQNEMADLPGFRERVDSLREHLDNDRAFANSIRGRPVVLGYTFIPHGELAKGLLGPPLLDSKAASQYSVDFFTADGFTANLPILQEATPLSGFFDNPDLDTDGIFRSVPLVQSYKGAIYPSLALAVTRVALGNPETLLEFEPPEARASLNLERLRVGEVLAPVDGRVSLMVPYRGGFGSFPYVPAVDVLTGTADAAVLKDAIVLVGTTAAGLLDLRSTPVGQNYAGVEVHANIISGLLDGRAKQKAPYYIGIEFTTMLSIGLLLAWLFPKVPPLASAGVAAGLIAAGVGLGFWAWQYGNFVMPMGVPITYTLLVFLAQLLYGYFIEARRARDTAKTFGQYVPKEIVEEMAASNLQISMDGKSKEMTVLFSDVRSFTTISEQFKDRPQELSELMNNFLSPLTQIIQQHRGTIDKYMGDCIMAFWGAPLDDPQHAENALRCAIELPKAMRALDGEFARRGWPPLHIGVGLSTGNMRVGNMGSSFRVAYTVMGDPVNLGSRVEGLTKEYGATVMCSEFTRAAGPADWSYRELDTIRVKGKDQPVSIFEPMGPKDALDPAVRQDLARHRGALKQFRAQKWDEAEAEFFNLSRGPNKHKVYEMFLERIADLRKNPPGPSWDGVYTFKHK
ncbi:MAG: CHASE2 domain-containing protein [Gammaproteobacteria bacterium]